jgi:hypothetical protein
MNDPVPRFFGREDSGFPYAARILAWDGLPAQQSDIASIAYTVVDLDDNKTQTGSGSLTVASTVYDTLQTDARWDADGTGYNFATVLPASCFPSGDHLYRVVITITPSSGEVLKEVFEVLARAAS